MIGGMTDGMIGGMTDGMIGGMTEDVADIHYTNVSSQWGAAKLLQASLQSAILTKAQQRGKYLCEKAAKTFVQTA